MDDSATDATPVHHPANHWGPFADDPFSAELDCVSPAVWQEAVRRAERSRLARTGALRPPASIARGKPADDAAVDQPAYAGKAASG